MDLIVKQWKGGWTSRPVIDLPLVSKANVAETKGISDEKHRLSSWLQVLPKPQLSQHEETSVGK